MPSPASTKDNALQSPHVPVIKSQNIRQNKTTPVRLFFGNRGGAILIADWAPVAAGQCRTLTRYNSSPLVGRDIIEKVPHILDIEKSGQKSRCQYKEKCRSAIVGTMQRFGFVAYWV